MVCVESPPQSWAVGQWYRDFSQTSDDEVVALLHRAAQPAETAVEAVGAAAQDPPIRDDNVEVSAGTLDFSGI